MTETVHRSRTGKPYRRVRRWLRHTTNAEIAVTMISLGIVLIAIAAVLAIST